MKSQWLKYIGIFICVIGIANIVPYSIVTFHKIDAATDTKTTLSYMEKQSKIGKKYQVSFYVDDFSGINYNLMDRNISYELILRDQVNEAFQLTYSNWVYYKEIQ